MLWQGTDFLKVLLTQSLKFASQYEITLVLVPVVQSIENCPFTVFCYCSKRGLVAGLEGWARFKRDSVHCVKLLLQLQWGLCCHHPCFSQAFLAGIKQYLFIKCRVLMKWKWVQHWYSYLPLPGEREREMLLWWHTGSHCQDPVGLLHLCKEYILISKPLSPVPKSKPLIPIP